MNKAELLRPLSPEEYDKVEVPSPGAIHKALRKAGEEMRENAMRSRVPQRNCAPVKGAPERVWCGYVPDDKNRWMYAYHTWSQASTNNVRDQPRKIPVEYIRADHAVKLGKECIREALEDAAKRACALVQVVRSGMCGFQVEFLGLHDEFPCDYEDKILKQNDVDRIRTELRAAVMGS